MDVKITIGGELEVEELIRTRRTGEYTHLISLRGSSWNLEDHIKGWETFEGSKRLQLNFDDVSYDTPWMREQGYVPPEERHSQAIIDFARAQRGEKEINLIAHCAAGVSRSTAAAYLFLCALWGPGSELESIVDVFRARDFAQPNPLLIRHGDWILRPEHGGKVVEVFDQIVARRKATKTYGSGY